MTALHLAQRGPVPIDLEPGEYQWCTCGHSRGRPYCDGSHEGTGFTPLGMVVSVKSQVYLCGCTYTSTPPFCDGSHGLID